MLTGPGTIIQPCNIGLLDLAPTKNDELYIHQSNDDNRLFFYGDFSGFHSYLIVTHTKFRVIPESVKRTGYDCFQARIYFEDEDGNSVAQVVNFTSPLFPIRSVVACKYGRDFDSFELGLYDGQVSQKFACNLLFISSYAADLEAPIPVKVEYIGMAAKNGRTAQERLGEGHYKLQTVLGELDDRDLFRGVSIILYKPGELDCKEIEFPKVVETLEASLIQHFKPRPLNVEQLDFPNNRTKLTSMLKRVGANKIISHIESPSNTSLYSDHMPQPQQEHIIRLTVP